MYNPLFSRCKISSYFRHLQSLFIVSCNSGIIPVIEQFQRVDCLLDKQYQHIFTKKINNVVSFSQHRAIDHAKNIGEHSQCTEHRHQWKPLHCIAGNENIRLDSQPPGTSTQHFIRNMGLCHCRVCNRLYRRLHRKMDNNRSSKAFRKPHSKRSL